MSSEIHILIIEDDFRVAEINRGLVERNDGFTVDGIAKSGDEAITFLQNCSRKPDLILLDVFIPDRSGYELLYELRSQFPQIDIIMLTAAAESETVKEAMRAGVFDYVLKPVDFGRFDHSLLRYRNQQELFIAKDELEQRDVDELFGVVQEKSANSIQTDATLPKGIDPLTLVKMLDFLKSASAFGVTAMEAGNAVGVSRSTSRRYLEYLVSTGEAKAKLNYGEIGRPERRYIPWTK